MILGLVAFAGLSLYGAGWWVSYPMVWWGRWAFRLSLLALLLGLMLPAELINAMLVFLSQFIPNLGEISDEPGASFGMHFLLFLAVSSTLLVFRLDLAGWVLVAALVGLSGLTEALQVPIPGRFGDWADVATNLIGVGLGVLARVAVAGWTKPSKA